MTVASAKKYTAEAGRTRDVLDFSPAEFFIIEDMVEERAAGTVRTGTLLYKGISEIDGGAGVKDRHVFVRVNTYTKTAATISFNGGRDIPLGEKIPVVVGLR